jgi:N-acetylmuramoyl-L-alanine amidase
MPTGRGWAPTSIAAHVPTSVFGYADVPAGSMKPIAIVDHVMQGYKRTMDARAKGNYGLVAQFSVARDGSASQHASIFDPTYHAGRLDSKLPTWPLYRQGVNPNKLTVGIEHEGFSVDPGNYPYDFLYGAAHPWPDPMIKKTIEIHEWCFEQAPSLGKPGPQSIIGHNQIAPLSRENDPGPFFPFERIIKALNGATDLPPVLSHTQLLLGVLRRSGRSSPIRIDGNDDVYELRLRRPA